MRLNILSGTCSAHWHTKSATTASMPPRSRSPCSTPQQYVQYRSELEGQSIFGAFRILRELETVPPFDKQMPFNSIGYLNGIELGQLYKDWKAGRLDDAQAVAAIADKVADTLFRRSDPAPGKEGTLTDQDGDGRLTHRDLYLRDSERIPRFNPQPDAPAMEPSVSTQPAAIPLLSDPAHPAHDLYAQTLRAFAASHTRSARAQHRVIECVASPRAPARRAPAGTPLPLGIDLIHGISRDSGDAITGMDQAAARTPTSVPMSSPRRMRSSTPG